MHAHRTNPRNGACGIRIVLTEGQPNKALHLTPANVAKMHEYNRSFRVEGAVQGRGAQVSLSVSRS